MNRGAKRLPRIRHVPTATVPLPIRTRSSKPLPASSLALLKSLQICRSLANTSSMLTGPRGKATCHAGYRQSGFARLVALRFASGTLRHATSAPPIFTTTAARTTALKLDTRLIYHTLAKGEDRHERTNYRRCIRSSDSSVSSGNTQRNMGPPCATKE